MLNDEKQGSVAHIMSRAVAIVAAVVAVSISARLEASIPGTPVPQSGQTLAVLLVGVILGARDGSLAMLVYLLAGALGLPVFADGAAGAEHLVGATSGYLFAFVLAAGIAGVFADRGPQGFVAALAVMLLGHAVILGLGWVRLVSVLGSADAYTQGVAPFLWGGVVKSVLAAIGAVFVGRLRAGQAQAAP